MSSVGNKKSPLWKYFTICDNDPRYALCSFCEARISRGGQGKHAGTTALWNHMQMKHQQQYSILKIMKNISKRPPAADILIKVRTFYHYLHVDKSITLRLTANPKTRLFL